MAKVWNEKTGQYEEDTRGSNADVLAAEKYNPALRSSGIKTQEQVESSGGLGALARKQGAEQSTPTPASEEKKKKLKASGLDPTPSTPSYGNQ